LLRAGHLLVAGMDEVGRGALAGPVTVGVVAVDASVRTAPSGVRDSKLLTPAAREALVPGLRRWASAYAVGHAEPAEIDRFGIIAALRLAGRRALAALPQLPTCVILDGSHDWLSPPELRPGAGDPAAVLGPEIDTEPLFELDMVLDAVSGPASPTLSDEPALLPCREPSEVPLPGLPQVITLVKADLRCAAVAAASVLAKVERDAIIVERSAEYPCYGWRRNKGYAAPEHLAALSEHGPCDQHRRSWSLPGVPCRSDVPDVALLGGDLLEVLDLEAAALCPEDESPEDEIPEGESPEDERLGAGTSEVEGRCGEDSGQRPDPRGLVGAALAVRDRSVQGGGSSGIDALRHDGGR
jgi:ribonuclease HII